MSFDKLKVVQTIYTKLAQLDDLLEELRIADKDCRAVESEMKALRKKLQEVMNSECPILNED